MATAKEKVKLTRKRLSLIIAFIVIVAFSLVAFQVLCQSDKEEDSPIEIYDDEGLTRVIGTLRQPGLFSDATLGWNNKSLWVVNNGEYPVEIAMHYYVLPEGWKLYWDYTDSPIEPDEVRKLTISVFAAYPIPAVDKLLGINLKYRVIDGK